MKEEGEEKEGRKGIGNREKRRREEERGERRKDGRNGGEIYQDFAQQSVLLSV